LKLLSVISLLPVLLTPAIAQTAPQPGSGRVELSADKLVRDGVLLKGLGHARAEIGSLIFQADEATLRSDSGELELRGHVRVALPARADHTVFRFRSDAPVTDTRGAVVTDQAVDVSADRMTVNNGILNASGSIVLRGPEARLQSDEMAMQLRTGDATLSGHILASGNATLQGRVPEMPVEIVK
jgi:hypothetical protein